MENLGKQRIILETFRGETLLSSRDVFRVIYRDREGKTYINDMGGRSEVSFRGGCYYHSKTFHPIRRLTINDITD